jgi:O-antigen/teichoic acid export membrane protein
MNLSFARGAVPLFSRAIVDQVVLSGANFIVGFVLIRFATDHDYGLFVLVQSALVLLVMMHNAYLIGPLSVLTPRLPEAERWPMLGSVKRQQRRLLRLVAPPLLVFPLVGYLTGLLSGLLAVVIAVGIIAGWAALRREFLRSVLLICSRPDRLLRADVVYVVCLLAGVGMAVSSGSQVVVGATFALVIAAWAGAAAAHRALAVDLGWREGGPVSIWPDIRRLGFWSLTGSTIYWFLGQSYSYILATRLDLTAVADVNATRLLLMPAIVMTIGLASLLGPTSATWYAEIGASRLVQRLLKFLLAVGILEAAYFAVVWMGRNWLLSTVLHRHIPDSDRLLLLWSGVAIIALVRDVLQCALIAMGHLKSLAWQVGISAAIAVVIMWYGIAWWGAAAVLIGQIVGELVNLAGIGLLLRKHVRSGAPQVLSSSVDCP